MLQCLSDKDFLAKLFCVRLAFDEILSSQLTHRNYFKQLGMDIMSSFLKSTNQVKREANVLKSPPLILHQVLGIGSSEG